MPRQPVPQWRPLAEELRRLRSLSGRSTRDVAEHTGLSKARVSRVELAQSLLSLPEIDAWVAAVSADQEARTRLHELAKSAHTTVDHLAGGPSDAQLQEAARARQTEAGHITVLQASIVPGLLQTAAYARRVFELVNLGDDDADIPAAVAGRMRRQEALYDPAKRFDFLITEAALRWPAGDAPLMAAVYDRIATVSTLENVDIGLIPTQHQPGAIPPDGFALYDDLADGEPAYVVAELPHAQIKVNNPDDVAIYRDLLRRLMPSALRGGDARQMLRALAQGESRP